MNFLKTYFRQATTLIAFVSILIATFFLVNKPPSLTIEEQVSKNIDNAKTHQWFHIEYLVESKDRTDRKRTNISGEVQFEKSEAINFSVWLFKKNDYWHYEHSKQNNVSFKFSKIPCPISPYVFSKSILGFK